MASPYEGVSGDARCGKTVKFEPAVSVVFAFPGIITFAAVESLLRALNIHLYGGLAIIKSGRLYSGPKCTRCLFSQGGLCLFALWFDMGKSLVCKQSV